MYWCIISVRISSVGEKKMVVVLTRNTNKSINRYIFVLLFVVTNIVSSERRNEMLEGNFVLDQYYSILVIKSQYFFGGKKQLT